MPHATKPHPKRKHPNGVLVNGTRIVPPTTPKGFPLTAHASGRYCVFRLGKMRYYGRWFTKKRGEVIIQPDGWRQAWDDFRVDEPDLAQGREPQPRDDDGSLTIGALCNAFLESKNAAVAAGELSNRTVREYRGTTDRLVSHFSPGRIVENIRPDDFGPLRAQIAKQFGPVRVSNEVTRVRSIFKFAFENDLIEKPVRFGTQFDKPSKAVLRRHRATRGKKLFEADELRLMLDALDGREVTVGTDKVTLPRNAALRAMILLGVNAGFYASDCGVLPIASVDLDNGWIDFPRPKTGVERRVPLWPETRLALAEVVAVRSEPRRQADAGVLFITKQRQRYVREGGNGCPIDSIGPAFNKVRDALGLNKDNRGFSALRHTFRTVADETLDQVAAMAIMGHSDGSISGIYRQRISDDRLKAVVEYVRGWLFG